MNKVVHFEIPADDLERSKKFYAETFGWKMQDYPEMSYVIATTAETDETTHMLKEPGAINGGMMKKGMVTAPSFAIEVDDVDAALEKVKAGGGSVLKEKMAVGDMGFMAYFKDTEGNILSVWQNAKK